jgi:hypothetical protein
LKFERELIPQISKRAMTVHSLQCSEEKLTR